MVELGEKTREEFEGLCKASSFQPRIWRDLLKIDGFANGQFKDGKTPLEVLLSLEIINTSVLQSLLSAGAKVNQKNSKAKLPLEIVFEHKDDKNKFLAAYVLIKKGAKLGANDKRALYLDELERNFEPREAFVKGKVRDFLEQSIEMEEKQSTVSDYNSSSDDYLEEGFPLPKGKVAKEKDEMVVFEERNRAQQVLLGLVDYDFRDSVRKSLNDPEYRNQLANEIHWTAYKLKKIKADELVYINNVYDALDPSETTKLKIDSLSPKSQNALLNVLIYVGKLIHEEENISPKKVKLHSKTSSKSAYAKLFIREIMNAENPDQIINAAEKALKNANITQSRGSGFYKVHSFFAKKHNNFVENDNHLVRSTLEELVLDLHTTLSSP